MHQMIQKRFFIHTILSLCGMIVLGTLPLEAGRRTGVHKDPAFLGDYYRTVGHYTARVSQKFTDLSHEHPPQKSLVAKRSRASQSSAVTSSEGVFEGRGGRVHTGRTPGVLPVLLLFMSLASTAEGANFSCVAGLCSAAPSSSSSETHTSSGTHTLPSTDPCAAASPPIDITCTDGSLYAGKHPVTNAKLYAMAQDAPSTLVWHDDSTKFVILPSPMDDCVGKVGTVGCYNGTAYTAYLANLTNPPNDETPYKAAHYCANLAPPDALALGHDDWYLPSRDELALMYTNLGPPPAHNFQNDCYWSSSNFLRSYAWSQYFSSGEQNTNYKKYARRVRCFRQ